MKKVTYFFLQYFDYNFLWNLGNYTSAVWWSSPALHENGGFSYVLTRDQWNTRSKSSAAMDSSSGDSSTVEWSTTVVRVLEFTYFKNMTFSCKNWKIKKVQDGWLIFIIENISRTYGNFLWERHYASQAAFSLSTRKIELL